MEEHHFRSLSCSEASPVISALGVSRAVLENVSDLMNKSKKLADFLPNEPPKRLHVGTETPHLLINHRFAT